MLIVEALRARIAGHDDIDYGAFEVPAGAITLVRGASGSGKSTLLHLLAGVFPVIDATGAPGATAAPRGLGRVRIGDIRLHGLSRSGRDGLRPRTVGWMPQRQLAISSLSVIENVLLPLSFAGALSDADRERAHDLLRALKVDGLAARAPATLSLGQLARVCLARAMVARPVLLLIDEPTAALDDASAALVAAQLLAAANAGAAVVIASHDSALQARLSEQRETSVEVLELPR